MSSFTHVRRAEQKTRAARQSSGTVYHQLLAAGHTTEDITREINPDPGTRRIGLATVEQTGSDIPVIGVVYGGDYRAEEERGIPEISSALSEGRGDKVAATFENGDRWALALAAKRGLEYNGSFRADVVENNFDIAVSRSRDGGAMYPGYWDDRNKTYKQLRAELKDAGVAPLPRSKADALAVYREQVRKAGGPVSVGEFHRGDVLVMLPVTPVLTDALRILAGSGTSLRMGGSNSPFGRGATLFDDRDLTAETIEGVRAHAAFTVAELKKAQPVKKLLEQHGNLYFLGNPSEGDDGTRYWLNFSPRGHKQVSGWFTLDQLRERVESVEWKV